MAVLSYSGLPSPYAVALLRIGVETALEKTAEVAPPEVSYALAGTLYLSSSGWLLLSVPSPLVRGVFAALRAPGVELPPNNPAGQFEPHITVMTKAEVAQIGADKISERGKQFHYTIGRFVEVDPDGWADVAAAYLLGVFSPELQALRRSYGLSSIPADGAKPFHITCAIRRRGVLGRNETSKV